MTQNTLQYTESTYTENLSQKLHPKRSQTKLSSAQNRKQHPLPNLRELTHPQLKSSHSRHRRKPKEQG